MTCIDTHCHYNLDPLYSEWRMQWQTAQDHGVKQSIIVGTNPKTSQRAVELAQQDPHLWATVGVHPSEYQELPYRNLAEDIRLLKQTATQQMSRSVVVAVGETGLDYFRLPTEPAEQELVKQFQAVACAAHMQLALDLNVPLILHVRDTLEAAATASNAYFDVLNLLKKHWPAGTPFVLHCVSGPLEYIDAALEHGAYLGVAANVTYPKSELIRQAVERAPVERLLSETDAPFLPPQGYRGQVCQPWMISRTVDFLHEQLSIDPKQLEENSFRLFPQLAT